MQNYRRPALRFPDSCCLLVGRRSLTGGVVCQVLHDAIMPRPVLFVVAVVATLALGIGQQRQ